MTTKLENKLDYNFQDRHLLKNALRHRSAGKASNERLEFLGDAVLEFIITSELYRRYTKLQEGELSRLRANLVRKESLANLARELLVGECLILGEGEKKSGGFRRDSILADAMEAIFGAMYLDSDIATCREKILTLFEGRFSDLDLSAEKDPKTRLQELLQAHQYALPEYEVVKTKGEVHERIFFVECRVKDLDTVTEGQGSNRQAAEQEAAEKCLFQLHNLTNKHKK